MQTKEEHIAELIHEVADAVVNFGGYADDSDESDRRSVKRDELERRITQAVSDDSEGAMQITFVGEAWGSFQTALENMRGYGVTITPVEGEPFEAVLVGPDYDADDGATVRFIRVIDGDYGLDSYPESAVESGVVKNIEVS